MTDLKFKTAKIPSISMDILVREDGKEIVYNGKKVHLSLIKNKNHSKGYHQVCIEGVRVYVHRLVAEAFVHNPSPLSYKMILHKDCNTLNNEYTNIEWGNHKKLIKNRIKNGIQNAPGFDSTYRGGSKISHEEALKIVERLKKGEYAKNICKEYGVSEMSIARIRKRYIKEPASIRYPKEVKETAMRLMQNHKPHELVGVTGIKYHTLYRWYKELQNNPGVVRSTKKKKKENANS